MAFKPKYRITFSFIVAVLFSTVILCQFLFHSHISQHIYTDERFVTTADGIIDNIDTLTDKRKNYDNSNHDNSATTLQANLPELVLEPVTVRRRILDPTDPHYDKERIMDMLQEMNVDPFSIDNQTWAKVPTWQKVTDIWGTEPVVQGLEHCADFRKDVPGKLRLIAVAGIFSTGTNLLAQLLQHNCAIPERMATFKDQKKGRQKNHGMEWQVPWGKHNPFRYRGKHSVKTFLQQEKRQGLKVEHYLPAVTIRDPYSWMSSICRTPYTFRWKHNRKECPNFVQDSKVVPVTARFGAEKDTRVPFDSLADVWNVWYGEYFSNIRNKNKDEGVVPAVLVRFEDIVFFPKEVTKQVCECGGGEILAPLRVFSDKDASVGNFHYVVGSSLAGPGHGGRTNPLNGLLESWIKYAKPRKERLDRFIESDVEFAEKNLNLEMMAAFRYDR